MSNDFRIFYETIVFSGNCKHFLFTLAEERTAQTWQDVDFDEKRYLKIFVVSC